MSHFLFVCFVFLSLWLPRQFFFSCVVVFVFFSHWSVAEEEKEKNKTFSMQLYYRLYQLLKCCRRCRRQYMHRRCLSVTQLLLPSIASSEIERISFYISFFLLFFFSSMFAVFHFLSESVQWNNVNQKYLSTTVFQWIALPASRYDTFRSHSTTKDFSLQLTTSTSFNVHCTKLSDE